MPEDVTAERARRPKAMFCCRERAPGECGGWDGAGGSPAQSPLCQALLQEGSLELNCLRAEGGVQGRYRALDRVGVGIHSCLPEFMPAWVDIGREVPSAKPGGCTSLAGHSQSLLRGGGVG